MGKGGEPSMKTKAHVTSRMGRKTMRGVATTTSEYNRQLDGREDDALKEIR